MPDDPYPILEVRPEWVLEPEAMGSKQKFWYRSAPNAPQWLFKYTQPNTGQHWAEKIAAEIAAKLQITHAVVKLAQFQAVRGSASQTFAVRGLSLVHGNQMLAGQVIGYDRE